MKPSDCAHADLERRDDVFVCRGCGVEMPRPAKDRGARFAALRDQLERAKGDVPDV